MSILYDKIIIVCDSSQSSEFKHYLSRFDVLGLNASTKLKQLICQNRLRNKLHLKDDDMILFTYNYSSLIKQCKHVLVIHDLLYLRRKLLPVFIMRMQRKLYLPLSIKKADKVIAISEFTRKDILEKFSVKPDKIIKIYNYFNFNKFSDVEDISIDFPFFLCVSSAEPHKNTLTIIKAFEKFCVSNSNVHLVLVGSLNNTKSDARIFFEGLDAFVRNRIHILHHISNGKLAYLYKNCMAYISATLFEGLGMPIVEAMYFNAPVVLSDLDVCKEVSSNYGIYFNPKSFGELTFIMLDFIGKKIKSDTRAMILEKYSSNNTSQKYIDLLNEL